MATRDADVGTSWSAKEPTLDFSHLTTEQRLDLIAELCESIDHDAVRLTRAQAAELDRRLGMLDAEPGEGRDAFEALADLRRGHA